MLGRTRWWSLVAWAALVFTCCSVFAANDPTISFDQYQRELQRVQQGIASLADNPDSAADLADSLPERWIVNTGDHRFEISNQALLERLEQFGSDPAQRTRLLKEMRQRIAGQITAAAGFQQPIDSSAPPKLNSILEQPEFRNLARGQSRLEQWKDLLLGWSIRLISRIFRGLASHPAASKVLLWTIIGLLVLAFAIYLKFLLSHSPRAGYSFPVGDGVWIPSSKSWQQWLAESRGAAEHGDWREAIHLGYWAGISCLEASGAWKPDRARTPREYVKLLTKSSTFEGALSALTWQFEVVWYAQQPAEPQDFQFVLAQLEKIGCR